MLESYAIVLILGCIYGFFIGLVPVAGATVGLIAITDSLDCLQTHTC